MDVTSDHEFAVWLADQAGAELMQLRQRGLEPSALKTAGDAASQEVLNRFLGEHRPNDAVLSEEGADDSDRSINQRVWIIDPVDGTREYSEPPREDWAVHVALWEAGDLVAGAVAQPALGETFSTLSPSVVPPRKFGPMRIAVSRSRPPAFVAELAHHVAGELVPMGSAGVKVMSVVRNVTDVYVHAGGQYEWDSAAPVVVARAAGLHTSRADGAGLIYNRPDPWMPDLLVCRPEFAQEVAEFVRAWWAKHGQA